MFFCKYVSVENINTEIFHRNYVRAKLTAHNFPGILYESVDLTSQCVHGETSVFLPILQTGKSKQRDHWCTYPRVHIQKLTEAGRKNRLSE